MGLSVKQEQIYRRGSRSAWVQMLEHCVQALGQGHRTQHAMLVEREETAAAMVRPLEELEPGAGKEYSHDVHLVDLVQAIEKRVLSL